MTSSASPNQEEPSSPTTEVQPVPWRKARIFAGLLTMYVGVQVAVLIIMRAQIAGMYGFLGGVMSGLGSGPIIAPVTLVFAIAVALPFLIGGIYFCGKRGHGRKLVWAAALLSVPVAVYGALLGEMVPGYRPGASLTSLIIPLLISVYLIWILRKTVPEKEKTPGKPSRAVIPKYLAAAVAIAGVALTLIYSGDILTKYNNNYWEPQTVDLAALSPGMPQGEVRRLKGVPYSGGSKDWDSWHFTTSKRPDLIVEYRDGVVGEIKVINLRVNLDGTGCNCSQGTVCDRRRCNGPSRGKSNSNKIPFDTVAQMHEILGPEDILAVSPDGPDSKYTYMKWGVSYEFSNERLVAVVIGNVNWRHYPHGEYSIAGQQVCPSEACPWDDEGVLKPEFEASNYRDLFAAFATAVREPDAGAGQEKL
jgi:hypothetical protein